MGSCYRSWDSGSSLLFWRWPCQDMAGDGIPPYFRRPMLNNQCRARMKTPDMVELIFVKSLKYLQRGYLVMAPASYEKIY